MGLGMCRSEGVQRAVLFMLVTACISGGFFALTIFGYTARFLDWVKTIGLTGQLIILVVYVLSGLPFPVLFAQSVLILGTGFIYGMWVGLATALLGTTLGLFVCLLIFRYLAVNSTQKWISHHRNLHTIKRMVDKSNYKLVILLRMVPVPFGVQNTILALSLLPIRTVLLSTWIGVLPEQLMGCYMGSSLKDLHDLVHSGSQSKYQMWTTAGELVGLAIVLAGIAYYAKKSFKNVEEERLKQDIKETEGLLDKDTQPDTGASDELSTNIDMVEHT